MQIKQSELIKSGINLPVGRYSTKTVNGFVEIYRQGGDTEGCILIGQERTDNGVAKSRLAFDLFMLEIEEVIASKQEVRCLIN